MNGSSLLKLALKSNAIFSSISGLIMIFWDKSIQNLFAIESSFLLLGIMLIGFALFVFSVERKTPISAVAVKTIIFLDVLWVIGSVVLLMTATAISSFGLWAIGIIAFVVGEFAVLQYLGLRKSEKQQLAV